MSEYKVGDRVRTTRDGYKGYEGTVEIVNPGTQTVWLGDDGPLGSLAGLWDFSAVERIEDKPGMIDTLEAIRHMKFGDGTTTLDEPRTPPTVTHTFMATLPDGRKARGE